MKLVCQRKCFFGGRLYHLGEPLEVAKRADAPRHFGAPDDYAKQEAEREAKELLFLKAQQEANTKLRSLA